MEPEPSYTERPSNNPWKRRLFITVIWLVTFLVVDLGIRLMVSGINEANWASRVQKFSMSPGGAGTAAVLAATITAVALHRQLVHTKWKDKNQAWWDNFEWTAERALPSDKETTQFPNSLSINILNSLQASSTSDLQKRACGGLLNHLAGLLSSEQRSSPEDSESGAPGANLTSEKSLDLDALAEYVAATMRTSARSRVAEALLYEHQVLAALNRIKPEGSISPEPAMFPAFSPDAVFRTGDQHILIEVKNFSPESSNATRLSQLRATVREYERLQLNMPLVFIAPVELKVSPQVSKDIVVGFVKWTPADSDSVLQGAIDRIANLQMKQPIKQ